MAKGAALYCQVCATEVDPLDGSAEAHRQQTGHALWHYFPDGPRGDILRGAWKERRRHGIVLPPFQLTREEADLLRAQ